MTGAGHEPRHHTHDSGRHQASLPQVFCRHRRGHGAGVVTAASYEYGNTFLIVSGLLNMLVAIDAYDVRLGRK